MLSSESWFRKLFCSGTSSALSGVLPRGAGKGALLHTVTSGSAPAHRPLSPCPLALAPSSVVRESVSGRSCLWGMDHLYSRAGLSSTMILTVQAPGQPTTILTVVFSCPGTAEPSQSSLWCSLLSAEPSPPPRGALSSVLRPLHPPCGVLSSVLTPTRPPCGVLSSVLTAHRPPVVLSAQC